MKCALHLSDDSSHREFLNEMVDWLGKLESHSKCLSCVDGWKLNINTLLQMMDDRELRKKFNFIMTRRMNQDCLEHFFGSIRGKGGHRDNPDCHQFRLDYRQSAVDHMVVVSKNANCEEEDCNLLLKLSNLYQVMNICFQEY